MLDAFRLALKVIFLVKKELTRYKESQDSDSHFLSNTVAKIDTFETYFLYVVYIVDFVKSDNSAKFYSTFTNSSCYWITTSRLKMKEKILV